MDLYLPDEVQSLVNYTLLMLMYMSDCLVRFWGNASEKYLHECVTEMLEQINTSLIILQHNAE